MTARAYYNEFDPFAAAVLRELIAANQIAPGDVDERSILDVRPDDLAGYTQCHFFAGIGLWSLALRRAGWPDHRPVWSGSCPCQPFSAAGKGVAFDDERHLWPAFFHLIDERRPESIFGEQVASKDGLAWVDLVHSDLENTGYTIGCLDLCAAGFGAPHIRQRLAFRADRMADSFGPGLEGFPGHGGHGHESGRFGTIEAGPVAAGGGFDLMERIEQAGPTNGFWRDADWIFCRDERWRPIEPGTFPLAHGYPARVGFLRTYGNAIVVQKIEEFIKATEEKGEVTCWT